MPEVDGLAVLAAAVAAFVAGGAYYAATGDRLARLSPAAAAPAPPWTLAAEFGRCLVLAAVVAGLASQGEVEALAGGLLLGLVLWIGFPLVLWTGAVLHERTPVALAVLHAGDWLVKLPLIGAVVTIWP